MALELQYAKVLAGPTMLEFVETPLKDVATYLSAVHGAPIKLDLPSLEKVGLTEASPVTGTIKGQALSGALKRLLDGKAEFVATDDALLIAGRDPALVSAPKSPPAQSPAKKQRPASAKPASPMADPFDKR